jgi:hypothetical protein
VRTDKQAEDVRDFRRSEAYIRGRLARQSSAALHPGNEFPEGSIEHGEWLAGWNSVELVAAHYADAMIKRAKLEQWAA